MKYQIKILDHSDFLKIKDFETVFLKFDFKETKIEHINDNQFCLSSDSLVEIMEFGSSELYREYISAVEK